MFFITVFVFGMELAGLSEAQEKQALVRETGSGGMGYSIFGQGTLSLEDLNTKLKAKGYTGFSETFFSVGGGGHYILENQWIIGGEAHTLIGEDAITGNYISSLLVSYGFANAGRVIWSAKNLRVYPLVGLGGGGMRFRISEDVSALSIDEVLDNPERSVSLSAGGMLLNFALGIDYLVPFSEDENGRGGMVLGIRAGYTLAPFKGSWSMKDIEISGAPEIGITGPYIRLIMGGGGFGWKNE